MVRSPSPPAPGPGYNPAYKTPTSLPGAPNAPQPHPRTTRPVRQVIVRECGRDLNAPQLCTSAGKLAYLLHVRQMVTAGAG